MVMGSRESSGNSSRFSLDVANLPLTPFGMRHHGSPRKLASGSSSRINKLSRKRGRDILKSKGSTECQYENKENIGGLNSNQYKKQWHVDLHTVLENETFTDSSCTPGVEEQVIHHSKDSQMAVNLRPIVNSPAAERLHRKENAPIESSGRRDSVFTDIDDGSFVEFCHVKEKGHSVPRLACDQSRKIPVYYTCESNNDTQYSTSTKKNNALVGFHKYVDKLRIQKNLRNVWEESETVEVRVQDRENLNDIRDETVITCSADLRKLLHKGPTPAVINSTVMDKVSPEERVLLPQVFSEISTLTVQPGMAVAPDSQHQSNQSPGHSTKYQTVILSESSDEGESQPGGGGDGCTSSCDGGEQGDPRDLRVPLIREEEGDVKSMPMYKVNASQSETTHPPPPTGLVIAKTSESPSVISEDISIVSTTPESRGNIPHKAGRKAVLTTIGMNIPFRRNEKVSVQHENREKEKNVSAGDGCITKGKTPAEVNAAKQSPENQGNPVYKWVISSPFKESSFDCSFLQKNEDSFISETPSQPRFVHKNESFESHAIEQNYKHLANTGTCTKAINSKSLNINHGSPIIEKSTSSDSADSECEFAVKRTTIKQRVIVSSSEESEDDKRKGMYVTRRRKKNKKITKSFGKDYIGASDSEKEESLCLRLSKSQNETNRASEKTTCTVGKTAASPEIRVKDTSNSVHEGLNKLKELDTEMHNSFSKGSLITPSPKTGDSEFIGNSEGPLDLSLIRKELDSIYTTEWRKNENAIFKTVSRERKQESRIARPKNPMKGPNRRRSKSCPSFNPESEEENSFAFKFTETSGGENGVLKSSEDGSLGSSEENKPGSNSEDEKTTKTPAKSPGNSENDSFHEYLRKARVQIKERKQQQVLRYYKENEDKYESSFINDDSSDDEGYTLPPVTQKPEYTPSVHARTHEHKSEIQDRFTKQEKRENSVSDGSNPSNRGNTNTGRITSNSSVDDSFEEYLKKAKVLIQQKRCQKNTQCLDGDEDQYESSFINDDSSDDESYGHLSIRQRPFKTSENLNPHKHKVTPFEKQDRGTTGAGHDVRAITTWRDSPTVILTSDSDSDESHSLTEKVVQPPSSYITPRTKGRGKILPKTEGHCRRFAERYETSQLSPRLSFLASLSSNVNMIQCHPDALSFVKNFKKKKEELAGKLYKYYNAHIFDGKLPPSMNLKWNPRLTKTAGYCYYQINNKSPEYRRGSRIELSTKVIDCCERLRDTLIHELCHAAAWIISGYKDGHGPLWKAWAAKARAVFPELPAINRCHSYQIQCKYIYRCTRCSYSIGRHSKSLDTKKKVCGHCFGKFELILNSKKQGVEDKTTTGTPAFNTPKTPKTPGPFALFVKENYGSVKKSTPSLKHGDVMRILSTKFGEMKTCENQMIQS